MRNELRLLRRTLERVARRRTGAPSDRPSIAVLPFGNMSADAENEYFSDGLSDELLNVLAKIPDLRVAARTSSFAFKGKHEDLREIGQKLNVATLLEGSVRKAGNRVRITVQLVKVADGYHLWSETYDRTLDDIFAVQDDIARAVSKALHVTLLGKPRRSSKTDAESYERLLQANRRGAAGLEVLDDASRVAVSRGPREEPRPGRRVGRPGSNPPRPGWLRIRPDWRGATRGARGGSARAGTRRHGPRGPRDPGLDHAGGRIRLEPRGRGVQASRGARAGGRQATGGLASYEALRGRMDEAVLLVRRAVEQDPLAPFAHLNRARIELWAGNYEQLRAAYHKVLELSPESHSAHSNLGLVELLEGRPEQAVKEIEQEPSAGYRAHALAMAYHTLGRRRESDAAVAQLIAEGEEWAMQIATTHAWRGEADAAFEWLERAAQEHDAGLWTVRMSPYLASLHGDPRWARFLARIGLGS